LREEGLGFRALAYICSHTLSSTLLYLRKLARTRSYSHCNTLQHTHQYTQWCRCWRNWYNWSGENPGRKGAASPNPHTLHVAVCYSVLQCVAVRCSALQRVAVCCSVLHARCSVLQCVAVCCSLNRGRQRAAASPNLHTVHVAMCCGALQCVAVNCRLRNTFIQVCKVHRMSVSDRKCHEIMTHSYV